MNWPHIDAIAPNADTIPNPVPLSGKGKISVTNKNNIA